MARLSRVDGLEPAPAALHVFRCDDGRWAWQYRETEGGFELNSNLTYGTREEAAESAHLAYPDLSFADDED